MREATHSIERGAEYLDRAIAKTGPSDRVRPDRAPKPAPAVQGGSEWAEPLPLTTHVDPQAYPLDAFPTVIRAAIEEVIQFTKAPIPLVASSALASLSLAAQGLVDVKRADKLQGPTGLFLLTIADSGERKSTCDTFFMSAIREHEQKRAEAAAPEVASYRAAFAAWEARRAGLLDAIKQAAKKGNDGGVHAAALHRLEGEMPRAPRVPHLIYGDATPEALTWGLAKTWPSGGVISSEAGGVLGAHGMGRDTIMRNLAVLNELWDGKPLRFDRRTSESFMVRGARLTVALQVQEATLLNFFDRSQGLARGIGFLARFLVSLPESTQGRRLFLDPPLAWPALSRFNQRIAAILEVKFPVDEDGGLTPSVLLLTSDTKAAWVAFHDEIERELRGGGAWYEVRDVASKAADNAARMAALFHVFNSRNSNNSSSNIDVADFEGAARIVAWHLNEARRFFGELALPVVLAHAGRLDKWLIERCRREQTSFVPTKTVQQFGPGALREKTTMEAAVRELEELGRARLVRDGRRKLIKVNPALLTGAAS